MYLLLYERDHGFYALLRGRVLVYEDEVEKSSMLFQWNGSIVILLNMMRGSGIHEHSGNSCCVLGFNEWRVNMVVECS